MGKYNDYLKKVQYRNFKEHDTSDGKVIEVVQDVSDIIEKNNKFEPCSFWDTGRAPTASNTSPKSFLLAGMPPTATPPKFTP